MKILASASVKQLHKNYSHLVNRSIANSSRGKLQTAILESFKIQGGGKIPLYKDLNFRAQKLKDFNLLHISRSFFCTNFREITCVTIQGAKQLQLAEFCKLLYAVPRKD